jgi:histone H3/H4
VSPAVADGLLLSFIALLTLWLGASVVVVINTPAYPRLEGTAKEALGARITNFGNDVLRDAGQRASARGWRHISKKDVQAAYRERRRVPRALQEITRFRAFTISTAAFILALPSFSFFPHLSPGHKAFSDSAGAAVAAIGFVFDGSEVSRVVFKFRRKPRNSARAEAKLRRLCERLARQVEKEARRCGGETVITADDVSTAWEQLVKIPEGVKKNIFAILLVVPVLRRAPVLRGAVSLAAVICLTGILYFGFSLLTTKLATRAILAFVVIVLTLFAFYLILVNSPRALAAVWKHRRDPVTIVRALPGALWASLAWLARKSQAVVGSLFRSQTGTVKEGPPNSGVQGPPSTEEPGPPTSEEAPHRGQERQTAMASQSSPPPTSRRTFWRSLSRTPRARRVLRKELQRISQAAAPFLTDDGKKAYWAEWEVRIAHAATLTERNRKQVNVLRIAAITSAITVPALVGLDLSGTGGMAVRWLTFAVSLITALSIAITTLFRSADRWLMYRTLHSGLIGAGWALINSAPGDRQAWSRFTAETSAAIARYDAAYQAAVIQVAQATPPATTTAEANPDPRQMATS